MDIWIEEKESKLFKVRIPAFSEEGNSNFTQIKSITILSSPMIASPSNSQSDLIISSTAVQGEIPSTQSDKCLIGEPVWTQGKAIRITEKSTSGGKSFNKSKSTELIQQWCTDCWITVLLSVQREGKYSIIAKASLGEEQIIYEDRVILGVAQYGEQECYLYNMKDLNNDLDVRFKTYSGILSLSINPQERPFNYLDSEFQIYSDSLDTFTKLTSQMRSQTKRGDRRIGPYFICIYAHTTSSFQILVRETDPTLQFELIEDGFSYNSQIISQKDQINKKIFVYQVPTLDYDNEDIKLNFQLEVESGPIPNMAIKYCNQFQNEKEQDPEQLIKQCADFEINSSGQKIVETIKKQNNSLYFWGQQEHGIPFVIQEIDHDEKSCKYENDQERNSNCFYIIVILNNNQDQNSESIKQETTKFNLVVSKFQKNYQILRANQPLVGQVERNQIKFYNHRFYGNDKAEKISIQLNTIHGDADLFVSRTNMFPQSQYDFDQISTKSNGVLDFVEFDKTSNDSLTGEYYIGVKGYSQSIFELQVRFQLEGQSSWNIMNLEELQKDSQWIKLSQGVEKQSDLHNEQMKDQFKFTVDMDTGFERTIRINIRKRNDKDIWVYVAYNRPCTPKDYDIFPQDQYGDKLIEIPVNTEFFHTKGTYYVLIIPRTKNIYSFFSDDWYSYAIKYSLDGSFDYVHPQQLVTQKQKQFQNYQYKFIIENRLQSQRLSINLIEGKIEYITYFDTAINMKEGKIEYLNYQDQNQNQEYILSQGNKVSVPITRQQIERKENVKCRDILSNCIFYIKIKCLQSDKDCYYQLKIEGKDDGLKQIIFGMPIQSSIDKLNLNYYYLDLNQKYYTSQKPIYIVLNTDDDGDADLYVSIQQNSDIIQKFNWTKPNFTNYDFKSQESISQDMIIIENEQIIKCFERSKQNELFMKFKGKDEYAECSIIIGVYGSPQQQFTEYQLISYMNLQHLMPDKSVQSIVQKNEYQYFIYEVNCDDCVLTIALQTFSGGNPNLYINYGDLLLPDKQKYNFKSTSYSSESIEISIKDSFFQDQKLQSIRGTYIIGVQGEVKSSFILSATHNRHSMITIQDQIQFHDSLENYETKIYKYIPDQGENMDDIKIQIMVNFGKVDIYVNTYSQDEDYENIIQKMPTSKKQSIYTLENLKQTSQISEGEIIFKASDKYYCSNCLYLIAVHSHDQESDYQLKVQLLTADFINSHFLKVGSPQTTMLQPNQTYFFKFIIDEEQNAIIQQENRFGETQTYISKSSDIYESFQEYKNSSSVFINTKSDNFQTGQLYYIIIKTQNEKSMITLTVSQNHSYIDFKNGMTQKIVFQDENDQTRNFIMSLPKGEQYLTIQVHPIYTDLNYKSKPVLLYKLYQNIGEVKDKIAFPPGGDLDFLMRRQYQGKEYLQVQQKLNVTENDEGIAFTIWMQHQQDFENVQHEVVVFASTQNELVLIQNQEYIKTIFAGEKAQFFKLDESFMHSQESYTFIEYSNCFGSQNFIFSQNLEDPLAQIKEYENIQFEGKQLFKFKNPLPSNNFYIQVNADEFSDSNINHQDKQGDRSQYTIKAFQGSNLNQIQNIKPVNPYIQIEQYQQNQNIIKLKWDELQEYSEQSNQQESKKQIKDKVNYFVFYSENMNANLSSVCTFEDDVWRSNDYKRFQTQNMSTEFQIAFVSGKEYKINVIAQVFKGKNKGYLYPFQSIKFFQPSTKELSQSQAPINKFQGQYLILFASLFILSAICVLFMIKKILNRKSNQSQSLLSVCISKIKQQLLKLNIFNRNRNLHEDQQNELKEYGGITNNSYQDSQKLDQTYQVPTI